MNAHLPLFPPDTIEAWALSYIESEDLGHKCAPPAAPKTLAQRTQDSDLGAEIVPGRPPELIVTFEKPRNFKLGALQRTEVRAALHHKFWHHELQAAELMCWAIVRFPDTPPEFKRGLVRIVKDEIRHMGLYEKYLRGARLFLKRFSRTRLVLGTHSDLPNSAPVRRTSGNGFRSREPGAHGTFRKFVP